MKYPDCIPPLLNAGITYDDAIALRRIAMRLHRWHELECGTGSGAIERDEKTGLCYWYNSHARYPGPPDPRTRVRDLETPALKRLCEIMVKYLGLSFYVQGDPRGAALYILRPGDVPEGSDPHAYYSRGLAVYH